MGRAFFGGGKVGMKMGGSRLPRGYTELAYIQSSGAQYINTGFTPNQSTKVSVVFHSTDVAAGVVAADGGWLTNGFAIFTQVAEYGASQYNYNPVDRIRTVSIDQGKIVIDGEQVKTCSGSFQTTSPLTICALNRNGTIKEYMTGNIYSCQIYDNGTLVRDFVPCMSDADGVGLYDLVNKKFYGNAGTGSFVGSEVAA